MQEGFLQILLRHRWTIVITTVLCLAVAFVYILKATPIFSSSSRLYVEQTGPRIMNEYDGVMTRSGNYLYTQGELMKSTPIVADAVETAGLGNLRMCANVDNVTAYVKSNLNVGVGRKDDIVTASFESPYPVEAATVVNAVVQAYIKYHSASKQSTAAKVLDILKKEKDTQDKELQATMTQLMDFTRQNGVVSVDRQGGNVVFDRLSKLSTALTEAQLMSLNAQADYEAAQSMADKPAKVKQFASASSTAGVRVFVNDTETQLRAELRAAEIELKNTLYHCTEEHPAVQAMHAKVDRIKSELNDQAKEFADSYIEVMQLRAAAAQKREDELQASFDTQYEAARDLGVKATEYAMLQSKLSRVERFCEILDNRIKELNVTEDTGALNISILEVARPAGDPSKPEKTKYMATALALGLMLGGGLAVLRDMLDYRLRSAEEISVVLGIPVLGVVPSMSGARSMALPGQNVSGLLRGIVNGGHRRVSGKVTVGLSRGNTSDASDNNVERAERINAELRSVKWIQSVNKRSRRTTQAGPVSGKAEQKEPPVRAELLRQGKAGSEKPDVVRRGQKAHLEPKSIVAEAYRTIRTAVFFGVPKDEAKTILITSPAPGDGKSTIASNLAIAMAQADQKTLIVDADFRKPMQHRIFEVTREQGGLADVVAGVKTLQEAVQLGPVGGLDVLSAGTEIPNPSEVLNSEAFASLLKEFAESYDRVIIDSPPVGPVADSQILSALCDVTLLVLRAEVSTRRLSQHARDSLVGVGGNLLGAVVNGVRRKHGHYGYYSSYGYYGRHGYYGEHAKPRVTEG
ncbi:MAG: polysaccharide biosynthesis tyrosine autokinase [Sedimentisphaerales bacterium]